jgi:DNA-binding transcriptional MerR regulator
MASELTPSQMAKQYSPRRERNWRFYGDEARKRLKMILLGKELGFSLAEIKETINNANADGSVGFEQLLLEEQILEQIRYLEIKREEVNVAITRLHENISRRRQGRSGGG